MDYGILSRVLDDIRDYGGDYVIDTFDLGHDADDPSRATITVEAQDEGALHQLLMRLQTRGVNLLDPGEAALETAARNGVLPDGFYATTNLETRVRIGGTWYDVENPEMDCGLVVMDAADDSARVRTVPLSDVTAGMRIVVGAAGIEVSIPTPGTRDDAFGQDHSSSRSDRPHAVLVRQVADGMRQVRSAGKRLLWVLGPGVVHTGAAPALVSLIDGGFVDTVFAGNAFATHDIEAASVGSSLGVDLSMVPGVKHGHENLVRAVNAVRKSGSIAGAVADGVVTSGIMHALITHRKRFVLVGSVRDDGPLPDVYTDVLEGQRAMRSEIRDVGYCLMMATQLHSVATGNMLPATVPVVCVDTDQTIVTEVVDRGSHHGRGIVTDVGLFLEQLARELVPDYRRG